MADYWIKDGYFWRLPSVNNPGREYEPDFFGFPVNGLGDLIFNTCNQILRRKDRSVWAYSALQQCGDLLLERKRWPDRMDPGYLSADSWLEWKISIWRWEQGLENTHLYRPQNHMTRDPFIAYYTLAVFLDRIQFIEVVKIPFYLYRPNVWAWRKYLISPNEWSLFWYKTGTGKNHQKKYVQRLDELMAMGVEMKNQ